MVKQPIQAIDSPKRKQTAFIKEEELKCILKDRAGTPHISELQFHDEVQSQMNVEELGQAGAAELVGDERDGGWEIANHNAHSESSQTSQM
tara:strand:- start:8726 stop:8998 length:273 start_codon:yes stop_codon:yes gene_type:complete